VPESAPGVSGITSAMRVLQPELVQVAVARERPRDPFRRKNRAYRRQGEWFNHRHPTGITGAELSALSDRERRRSWTPMVRDAAVFAKGAVRHPDHATIVLHDWHRVAMNTEQRARAMQHIAFLD
jgi:hypothetical protein